MKKPKKPGDNISLKTKKNESPVILEWINSQTNLMDSIRYLIENEVRANGVRNLQAHIPAERSLSVHVPSSTNADAAIAHYRNVEAAATSESLAPSDATTQDKPHAPKEAPLLDNETIKTMADDDIDEEDIDSWT